MNIHFDQLSSNLGEVGYRQRERDETKILKIRRKDIKGEGIAIRWLITAWYLKKKKKRPMINKQIFLKVLQNKSFFDPEKGFFFCFCYLDVLFIFMM